MIFIGSSLPAKPFLMVQGEAGNREKQENAEAHHGNIYVQPARESGNPALPRPLGDGLLLDFPVHLKIQGVDGVGEAAADGFQAAESVNALAAALDLGVAEHVAEQAAWLGDADQHDVAGVGNGVREYGLREAHLNVMQGALVDQRSEER